MSLNRPLVIEQLESRLPLDGADPLNVSPGSYYSGGAVEDDRRFEAYSFVLSSTASATVTALQMSVNADSGFGGEGYLVDEHGFPLSPRTAIDGPDFTVSIDPPLTIDPLDEEGRTFRFVVDLREDFAGSVQIILTGISTADDNPIDGLPIDGNTVQIVDTQGPESYRADPLPVHQEVALGQPAVLATFVSEGTGEFILHHVVLNVEGMSSEDLGDLSVRVQGVPYSPSVQWNGSDVLLDFEGERFDAGSVFEFIATPNHTGGPVQTTVVDVSAGSTVNPPDAFEPQFVDFAVPAQATETTIVGINEKLDVNPDGTISPVDALLVINELNDPSPGRNPSSKVTGTEWERYDVNGDGYLSPVDALIVINQLNAESGAEGEGPLGSSIDVSAGVPAAMQTNAAAHDAVFAGVGESKKASPYAVRPTKLSPLDVDAIFASDN